MSWKKLSRKQFQSIALAAVLMIGTGCGRLTIRTWIKVVEADSSGFVRSDLLGPDPLPFSRVQGGFLAVVTVDTSRIPAPLDGTIVLEDVRVAAEEPTALGRVCTWGDPAGSSAGTVHLDLFGGASSADLVLDVKATTELTQFLPPVDLEQPVSFPLGSGLSLETLAAAAADGSADGLFATDALFEGDAVLFGSPVRFVLDLAVTNESTPPLFDAALLDFCGARFTQQGGDLLYVLNSKSSYLRAWPKDDPQPPRVIPLADIGAAPGDVLRIARVGTYADATLLKDGTDTAATAVFSATDEVRAEGERVRIPGAIDAGADVNTGGFFECFLIFCSFRSSDIPHDFRFEPSLDVTVPAGANFLVVAPLPPSRFWSDDSGFGFGVSLTVNPAP
jgi:hypothetical protein